MQTEPHSSHEMEEWESTIVDHKGMSNARFGQQRCCKNCEGEEVLAGGAGSRWRDPELEKHCEGKEEYDGPKPFLEPELRRRFLDDIRKICELHGVVLSHEDTSGSFVLRPWSDELMKIVEQAYEDGED